MMHRRIYTAVFLLAILMQVFTPAYSAHAVVGAAVGATTGTATCAAGVAAGSGAGAIGAIVGQAGGLPTHDKAGVLLLGAIAGVTIPGCIANVTTAGSQVEQTFWQRVLNVAAYAAINIVLQTITRQIIGWIQGNDSGFIQNLQAEALRTADAETGRILNQLIGVNLCGNIGAFLKLSIGAPAASFRQRMQCSLTGIVQNVENFYQNFADGGWPAFFSISMEPQNNAYGAFLLTAGEQFQRQSGKQESLTQKLLQGSGFKGFEVAREANCQNVSAQDSIELRESIRVQSQNNGRPEQSIRAIPNEFGEQDYSFCDVAYDTKTPGKLFADALPAAAFSGLRRTELATQIDQGIAQIITALLQRIIQESVSGGRGLFGARDIGSSPQTTLVEAGFHTDYITNQTDDSSLRLEASYLLLDAKIQDRDTKIAAINAQITPLETACSAPNPGDTCNRAQLDALNAERVRLATERATALTLLSRAHRNLIQILDLRTRFLATTNTALLENLNTKLIGIQSDAEQIIQQADGPSAGQIGVDADDNFIRIIANAQDRATAIIAYLEKRITAETDQTKKSALIKARDDLKKLADDLDALREDFLDAISDDTPTAGIVTEITGKIGEINDKILSVYSL